MIQSKAFDRCFFEAAVFADLALKLLAVLVTHNLVGMLSPLLIPWRSHGFLTRFFESGDHGVGRFRRDKYSAEACLNDRNACVLQSGDVRKRRMPLVDVDCDESERAGLKLTCDGTDENRAKIEAVAQ